MGSEGRGWGFSTLVGILLILLHNGRCEGTFEQEGITAAEARSNGSIGHCLMEEEAFMDDTDEIKNMYESVELVMDSEISRRILQASIPYKPLQEDAAKQGTARGRAYTRPCNFKNQCDRPGGASQLASFSSSFCLLLHKCFASVAVGLGWMLMFVFCVFCGFTLRVLCFRYFKKGFLCNKPAL